MQKAYSQDQVTKTLSILQVIGDVANLLILFELINFGEKSFNELKRMTNINPVTLSKKLGVLKQKGLVDVQKVGKENHYYPTTECRQYVPIIKEIERIITR